jgi:hypothetical protein
MLLEASRGRFWEPEVGAVGVDEHADLLGAKDTRDQLRHWAGGRLRAVEGDYPRAQVAVFGLDGADPASRQPPTACSPVTS